MTALSDTQTPIITRLRLETRRRTLTVRETIRLTPRMVRIVFEGAELSDFVSPGADDHIKLFFADPQGETVMRDYTPRAYDHGEQSLTVDFALREAGPATAWAQAAQKGDTLQIGGPRGSSVIAQIFDWWLMIGDETALPAIARRSEELAAGTKAITLVAVTDAQDEQGFAGPANVERLWVHRPGSEAADPTALLSAARNLSLPEGRGFIWIAAEAGVARALRDHFLAERGHPRHHLKAAGYWVAGTEGSSDKSL